MTDEDEPTTAEGIPAAERPLARLSVLFLPNHRFLLVLSNCDGLFPDEIGLIEKVADKTGAEALLIAVSPLDVG